MSENILWTMFLTLWPVSLAAIIGAWLERLRPRSQDFVTWLHWLQSGILFIAGVVFVSLVVPISHAGASLLAESYGWGVLNTGLLPVWVALLIGVLALDFSQWFCHWILHHSRIFWRIHRLHHSDTVIDVSSAFRFHPAESLFRFVAQLAVILLLGVPVAAIIISFSVTLAFNVWEHANMKTLPFARRISRVFLTPDLHRMHHGIDAHYQICNLGTIFTIWDQLFGTYISDKKMDGDLEYGLGPKSTLSFRTLGDLFIDPIRKD